MKYPDYLVHFNPNHDPKTGQFTYTKNGSKRTEKLANKLASSSSLYGRPNQKLLNQFIESSRNDEDEAMKYENYDAAKSIAAGRTYMRVLVDPVYRQMAIDNAAKYLGVSEGQKFAANFLRDDLGGGVKVTNRETGENISFTDSKYDFRDVDYV